MFGIFGGKSPTWEDLKDGRPFGHMERWHAGRAVLNHYAGTALTCRYSIPDDLVGEHKHEELAAKLELAVARVVLDQPMLQARVVNPSAATPAWARLHRMDLSKHVSWTIVDDVEAFQATRTRILLELLDGGFPDRESRPSWNLAIVKLKNGAFLEVILDWCHLPFDGMGAKTFHQSLLQSLNADADDIKLDGHVLDTTFSKTGLPPAPDLITHWPLTIPYLIQGVWHEMKPDFLRTKLPPTSWPPPIDTRNRQTNLDSFDVKPDVLKRVVTACRAHNTTVTGLLQAVTLVSLFSLLPEDQHPDVNYSMTATNLRPHMPEEIPGFPGFDANKTIFNMASVTPHPFDAPLLAKIRQLAQATMSEEETKRALAEVMWEVAARVRAEVKAGVDQGLTNEYIALGRYVNDWTGEHKRIETKPRRESILNTNLGAFEGKQAGARWSIERATFTLAADITGYALTAGAVSVKGGDFCVDVTWQDGTVKDELAHQVTRDMKGWFEYVASNVNV